MLRVEDVGRHGPVIDRAYALEAIVDAVRYVESGQKTGSVERMRS